MPQNTATGPKPGKSRGRNRNTGINLAGKQPDFGATLPAQPFPLGPSDQTAFGLQRTNLRYQYRIQNAALRAQAQMARLGFRNARGEIQQNMRAGLSETQGAMTERGLVGSTVNMAERETVRGEAASQRSAAREEFIQQIMGTRLGRLQNIAQFRLGLGELALQRAAAKRELALSAFAGAGVNPWGYQTNVGG